MARNEVRFLDSIGLLLRYSMVETQEGSTGSYSMHPVVHRWASFLDDDRQKHESARLALIVVGSSVPMRESREYWVLQQKLLPHAERCAEWMQEALAGADVWYIGDELVMGSLHMLGLLYSDQGKFKEAEEMYERALEGKEKALGPHHTSTLMTVNNLGLFYWDQGKFQEAEEMYERALEGYEKALGPNHTSTLGSVHCLGILYSDQGKFKEAEEMYERALRGFQAALGPNHPKSSMVMRNMESLQGIQCTTSRHFPLVAKGGLTRSAGISISTNKEAKSTGGPKALGRLVARIRGIVKPRRVERPNESTQ
ncbi:hypothetical protein B0J13DRAFT_514290 [Dactylonectria estremocensis]|uniref:Kinesin light chain n=1 Tax=Dactylonectria estremocensis TaxID=1079267 RepID=A0A9P9DA49_9HYPO|nr:hypothetical protein B0J13DRAFT_514290 [Dactylonectria estremocensis]